MIDRLGNLQEAIEKNNSQCATNLLAEFLEDFRQSLLLDKSIKLRDVTLDLLIDLNEKLEENADD